LHLKILNSSWHIRCSAILARRKRMRPRVFSTVISLCFLFVLLLFAQTVRPQTPALWLQGNLNDADPDLERLNRAFVRLAEKVRRAVVHVRVEPTKARGSGFVIDPRGYILTAQHVVSGAREIEIRLANRERVRGEVVAMDAQVDFAIVKIDADREFPALPLSDSDGVKVGELVGSLGFPFGLESSLHVGIVGRRGKRQNMSAAFDHIQVDSPANPGESGGPLVDMKGHVVGMITQASESRTIGFAVPINVIKAMIPRLLAGEKIAWGWLGVKLSELTLEWADRLSVSPVRGVLVSSVLADQPAGRAGVLSRDVILSVDDIAVDRVSEVLRIIKGTEVGKEVTLTIFRSGATLVVPVTLGRKPPAQDEHEG
jgi:serine protease Do